ncbi:type VI secretion system tip protein VgrG [Roseivirga pacifica]
MADSPITDEVGVVTFEITSGGSKLKDAYQVQSIHVRNEVNKIPTAKIVLLDGDPSTQDFPISDSEDLIPGKEIEIKVGYKSNNESIFKGIVVNHGISLSEHGGPKLEVEIKDKALKLTVGRKNTYFEKKKDSDIISSIISDAGLSADVEATTVENPMVVQHYTSDWDFLMTRADINGKLVTVSDGKVTVAKPNVSASAVLTTTYGADLLRFSAEMNSRTQLSAVQGTAWDQKNQAIVQNTGAKPSVNAQGNLDSSKLADVLGVSNFGLQSAGAVDSDSLKAWSDAQFLKSWMNKITGTASFQGSAKAVPGCIVEFQGVGERFNGNAFISGVEHEVANGNWVTTVKIGLTDEWYTEKQNIDAPSASGQLPGVDGLTIGKVKQLDSDPDNEFRILITLPLMQDDSNGVWARLSNFYATNTAGTFFIPEVDDEVVVGFLNGDPRFPIILGSLYSSKIKPGKDVDGNDYALTADNYTKAFLTKALNKIEFNDQDKIITVTTPGENKMVWDDKDKSITAQDQNGNSIVMNSDGIELKDKTGNKITMSSSGIEINSPKDVKVVATQDINNQATSNIQLQATQNFEAKGLQVSLSADTSFTAKGNASAELSASGQTTVKGAMVMIN